LMSSGGSLLVSAIACRPVTLDAYRFDFDGVYKPAFGDRLLDEISREDVKRFLKQLDDEGASARTRAKHLIQLRGFFREMVLDRKCSENPCEGVKAGRGEKRENVALSFEQARALIKAAREDEVKIVQDARRGKWRQTFKPPPYLFVAIVIACYTGLRRSNIVNLKWKQMDLGARKISIPAAEMKAKRAHEVPIHPALLAVLEGLLRGRKAIDPEARVLGAQVATIRDAIHGACRRAGIPPVGWHTLRHSWCSWLAPRCSFPCLKTLMAHAPGNLVTLTYAHPSWEELVAAVGTLPDLILTADGAATKTTAQG